MGKAWMLGLALFATSLAGGLATPSRDAYAAKPKSCPYCYGNDRCGRGTLGAGRCAQSPQGCQEAGDPCEIE